MLFPLSLRRWSRGYHAAPRRKPSTSRRTFAPRLEFLENRTLLSTYLVDRLTDTGAGSGLTGDLRYCITQAVNGDAINFGITGTINLTSALPDLTHNISINGPGADVVTVRRNGDASGPVFRIFTVAPAGATVSISGLTIANGLSGDTAHGGGGIYNQGTLTLSNCTVTQNQTITPPTYGADGGGISNWGTATLNNCTITNNTADGFGGGVANEGGLVTGGTMTIANCTISGNTAYGSGDSSWSSTYGGGIYNGPRPPGHGHGNLVVTNSTITGNVAVLGFSQIGGGGGIASISNPEENPSTVNMQNSILAGNSPDDLYGDLTSSAYNLIGGNPLLGPLQDNGGPTQTMALLPGSPALNTGDPSQLGVADQRGVVRSGGVNIGAYQASASAFVLTAPATVTAGTPFDLTVKAVDSFGQTALGYTGTVTFSTTDPDPGVVLPAPYTFTLADQGTHTFSGGFTLLTPGTWTLTATDPAGGFSANVSVTVTSGGGIGQSPNSPRSPRGLEVTDRLFAALPEELSFPGHAGTDEDSGHALLTAAPVGLDPVTRDRHNHAATSNDDCSGG